MKHYPSSGKKKKNQKSIQNLNRQKQLVKANNIVKTKKGVVNLCKVINWKLKSLLRSCLNKISS